MKRAGTILLLSLVTTAAEDAGAERRSDANLREARQNFQRGEKLFRSGEHEAAADAYWAAYELSGKPELLFNCGQALRLAGVGEAAILLYREFLGRAPEHSLGPLARAHLAELEAAGTEQLESSAAEELVAATAEKLAARPAARIQGQAPAPGATTSITRSAELSPARRHIRVGATARAAMDLERRAGSGAIGALLDLGPHLRLAMTAFLGQNTGGYAGAALRLGSWRLRPHLAAGVPVFFADRAHAGVRGAAGVSLEVAGPLDLALELGAEHFFSAPDGYQRTLLVPILALEVTP